MATCPNCGVSSRQDEKAITIERVLYAHPIGDWSLAGQQMKASATQCLRMSCQCGWSILGHLGDDEHFYGSPSSQVFPPKQ